MRTHLLVHPRPALEVPELLVDILGMLARELGPSGNKGVPVWAVAGEANCNLGLAGRRIARPWTPLDRSDAAIAAEINRVSISCMKADLGIKFRPLSAVDLDGANAVIELAIMTWQLPDRVKRLSLPSYRYNANDLEHLTLVGAVDEADAIVGVVSWEPASTSDTPDSNKGLLLHGIYVVPRLYRTGIGSRLLDVAIEAARQGGFGGLLVKANRDAQGFFSAKGLQQLSVMDAGRDYPYRFWWDLRND